MQRPSKVVTPPCHPHYPQLRPASYGSSTFTSTACWLHYQMCPQLLHVHLLHGCPLERASATSHLGYDRDPLTGLPRGLAGIHFSCTTRRSPVTRPAEHIALGSGLPSVGGFLSPVGTEAEAGTNPTREEVPSVSLSPEVCEQQPPTRSMETAGTEEVPGNDPPRKPPQAEALMRRACAQRAPGFRNRISAGLGGTANTELQAGEECRVPLAWLAERELPCSGPDAQLRPPGFSPGQDSRSRRGESSSC